MRISLKLLLIPLFTIMLIPASAEETEDECIFTVNIEKSWIYYNESPWVRGTILDCDTSHTATQRLAQQDRIHVELFDINGERLDEDWTPQGVYSNSRNPTTYNYYYDVYREGNANGNFFNDKVPSITINPNEYFFYLPTIVNPDFNHREIYQIKITYSEHVRWIQFAVLNPNVWYDDPDYCENAQGKLSDAIIQLESNKKILDAYEEKDEIVDNRGDLLNIEKQEQLIKDLSACRFVE